jgi:hypothetical protein
MGGRTGRGRPPLFHDRRRLVVFLDASELRALQGEAGKSVSAYVRRLVQTALRRRRKER